MLREELKAFYNTRIWKEKYGNLKYLALFFFIIFVLFLSLDIATILVEFPLFHLYFVITTMGIVIIIIYFYFLIDLRNSIPFLDRIRKKNLVNILLKKFYKIFIPKKE